MSFDYIRNTYGVPAKRGMRVLYTGGNRHAFGTITSAKGAYVFVKIDGAKYALPYHPTWELTYAPDESVRTRTEGETE